MDDTPFTRKHVLRITMSHMMKCIDKSMRKTMQRLDDRSDQSLEILDTLNKLNVVRELNEEFIKNNPNIFEEEFNETISK